MLDIHTHHKAPQPLGVISTNPEDFSPVEGQLYSVGIHPWDTLTEVSEETIRKLDETAAHPSVALIGETGIDTLKGGLMFRQINLLKHHIELSEQLGKPLILHDVKAHDIIIGIKKEVKPLRPWIIHGFRGKPSVADMLLREGFYLSFGKKFNADSLRMIPEDKILAETDESELDIIEIISNLEQSAGKPLREVIKFNTSLLIMENL